MPALRAPLSLLALALSTACATAASRDQIISVDSSPRGALITRTADGAELGTTPVLLSQPRAGTQDYTLRFSDGATRHLVTTCEARTAFLIADAIPGLPLLVLPPPLNVVGFVAVSATLGAIDTAGGAVFDCPAAVVAKHPSLTGNVVTSDDVIADIEFAALPVLVVEACPRFLVVPPIATSELASQQLTAAAADELLKLSDCATVVDAAEAMAVFGRKKITWQRALVPERFTREHAHEIAFKTKATHFVQLEPVADGARLRLVDVHSLQPAAGPSLTPKDIVTSSERDLFRELLLYGVGLVPDTFVWNAAAKFFPFQSTSGEQIVQQGFTNPLLASAINFQLYHLDNPEAHGTWDYALTIGPNLLFLLNGSRMVLQDDDGARRVLTLNVIQAIVPISPRATFFTPAGLTAVWVGAGPALIVDWDDPDTKVDWRLTAFVHGGISHDVFLTRTVFVGVSAHANRSLWPHVLRDGVRLDWFLQAQVNLGISFPDFTYDVADWL